ncbi:MAG: glycosyltransferase family 4 protein [Minisyncoccota bacterium]
MKMCEAFAHAGAQVELVVPNRRTLITEDSFDFYGVEHNFSITRIPILEFPLWIPGAFRLQTFIFSFMTMRWIKKNRTPDVVYMRGEVLLLLARLLPTSIKLVWETHIKPGHPRRYDTAVHRLLGVVAVTKYFTNEIPTLWNISPEQVCYAPDGVQTKAFNIRWSKSEVRQKLQLPIDKKIVLYVGSDLPWKGLRYLRAAGKLLPDEYLIVFVGPIKPDRDISHKYVFSGVRPPQEVPLWLSAADIFILTGDPASEISQRYTSPMKLFEYLAAEKPIVAMNIPAFREILDESTAYFAASSDPHDIAYTIQKAANDPENTIMVTRAKSLSEKYSWSVRGAHILAFIEERIAASRI